MILLLLSGGRGKLAWFLFCFSIVQSIDIWMSKSHIGKELPFDSSSVPNWREDWRMQGIIKKKNPTADSLLSSSIFAKVMEIFLLLLNFIFVVRLCHSVKLLRETSLYRHGHNFTHPKVMRVNYGETSFLNSRSQPNFTETLTTQQIQNLKKKKKSP